jgi:lon-related putative ATP-dependent protease
MKKRTVKSPGLEKLRPAPHHDALPPSVLRWQCDPAHLNITTTDDIKATKEIIGQERALRALHIGLEIHHDGYNIFVTGEPGTGRMTTIRRLLTEAETRKVDLRDYCYVYNFRNPDMPVCLVLPAGQGCSLRQEMEDFVRELKANIPSLFESQRYQEARKATLQHFQDRQKSILHDFEKRVREQGFELVQVQVGNMMRPDVVPVSEGTPVSLEQLEAKVQKGEFAQDQFEKIREAQSVLEKQMAAVFRELRNIEKKVQQSLTDLEERFVMPVVDESIAVLKATYQDPKVVDYFEQVREHIRTNLDQFRSQPAPTVQATEPEEIEEEDFSEYAVNVLVDNSHTERVPIIIENNPKYKNIFGTVERELERGGVWRTDFLHIKAGSLLRANGGYLVLNALDTLVEPWAWQDLKRTLRTRKVEIATYEPLFGLVPTAMKPEAIDLDVKVIMVGDPWIYQLLYLRDEDFKKIFKIRADFDSEMQRSDETVQQYLRFIKLICEEEKLLPLDASAVSQVIEFGVRLAGRKAKLTTRFNIIADVVREANYWSSKAGALVVSADHVEKAIAERIYRVKLLEDKIQEMITEGTIMIDTDGSVVGQVNGLSVYDVGEHAFGKPSRITAKTALGRTGIINIEREAELSGPTHNKGVAILTGYLRSRFAQKRPLVMDASITFEQSYGGVDGDSASSTEIFAILSSLSDVPIRQDIAVTGSVNQKGEIQPIGGVNLKIEGFFDVCRARGLTGQQGVIIPKQNVDDLMLREDVVSAVSEGNFHIWAISTIDEGIEILTGVKAGAPRTDGSFEPGTINGYAARRLFEYSEYWKKFGKG